LAGVMIVTGGARGIGAATAKLAASAGYDVCLSYVARDEAARDVVAAIEQQGRRAVALRSDVSREADIQALFEAADRLGPLAALINNAGIPGTAGRLDQTPTALIEKVIATNITGLMLCTQLAIRRMSKRHGGRGGAIVNLSSVAARLGGANVWIPYATSKGAVEAFTHGIAQEVAAEGIRVVAVRPGIIDTEIHASAGLPDRVPTAGSVVPMGRAGTPEEVAELILFLLSDKAAYITDTVVDISGGR
jgi:NAD(P)-dependent dehydrogenase (short-subunit alcohol dehydrogenase family)